MNEERELVLAFLKENSTDPLQFLGYNSGVDEFKSTDVDSMVLRVLQLKDLYDSGYKFFVETLKEKRRSVLDIWRHIIYYYPDITIFQVMNSLYNLVEDNKVDTLYCDTIHRRTFQLCKQDSYKGGDEFGLKFIAWKDI